MNGPSHRIVTKKAIFLLSKEKKDNIYPIGEDNLLDPNSKDLSPKAAEMLEKNSGTTMRVSTAIVEFGSEVLISIATFASFGLTSGVVM